MNAELAGPRLSVLLVEDDRADALLVSELFADARADVELVLAASMSDAMRELSWARPDCVLLDLNLPDANGIGAVASIMETDERLPVVVLTGISDADYGLQAVQAGAQDYLVKGFVEPELLIRAVLYAIERKRAEVTSRELHAAQVRDAENVRLERGLLPTPVLHPDSGVDVVARYRSSRENGVLGCDFYDVVQTPDEKVHVVIGDVSGHGPDEAALGAALRISWRALVLTGFEGLDLMHLLDEIMRAERDNARTSATVTSLVCTPAHATVTCIRAGHPGMLMHNADDVWWLDPHSGPALGLAAVGVEWSHDKFELPHGHGLVLVTDGVFEGYPGMGNDRVGEAGLLAMARPLARLRGQEFVDTLIEHVEERARPDGGLSDDVAVVRIERTRGD